MFMWFPSRTDGTAAARPRTTWSAPGTCGEFVQGRLDGVDYLLNSPIDRYATATVRATPGDTVAVRDAHLRPKAAAVLARLAEHIPFASGFEVDLTSALPAGKGMASSTADLVATIGAAMDQARATLSTTDIARLLVAVEPSDCTHVPGVGHVGHLCGRVFGSFAAPPALRTLIVDCGGAVDTVSFDRARAHRVYAANEDLVRRTLHQALAGLRSGDVAQLAQASTASAQLSQQILPKPQLPDLVAIGREHDALGVCCAHSGSVVGLLYRPGDGRGERLRHAVTRHFGADAPIVGDHRFISGGIYVRRR